MPLRMGPEFDSPYGSNDHGSAAVASDAHI